MDADGSRYEGQWAEDRRHGTGAFVDGVTKVEYQGEWIQGQPAGTHAPPPVLRSESHGCVLQRRWLWQSAHLNVRRRCGHQVVHRAAAAASRARGTSGPGQSGERRRGSTHDPHARRYVCAPWTKTRADLQTCGRSPKKRGEVQKHRGHRRSSTVWWRVSTCRPSPCSARRRTIGYHHAPFPTSNTNGARE